MNSRPTYMPASSKRVHCCIHVSRLSFFGWAVALYCTCVHRMCRVVLCPILLVRTWYHAVFSCDNNSVSTTLQQVLAHQQQACPLLFTCDANYFFCDWDVALYCTCVPGTWYVSLEEMKT